MMNAGWMRWSCRGSRARVWLIFHVCLARWSWYSAEKVQSCSTLSKQAPPPATANWDDNPALAWISPTEKYPPPHQWLDSQCAQQPCGSVNSHNVQATQVLRWWYDVWSHQSILPKLAERDVWPFLSLHVSWSPRAGCSACPSWMHFCGLKRLRIWMPAWFEYWIL